MATQNTTNHILIDLDTEGYRHLLGYAGTTPVRITPFHLNNGADYVFLRSFGSRSTTLLGCEQHAVFPLLQQIVEIQQSGRLPDDGGTEHAGRTYEKSAQANHEPIRRTQVRSTLSAPIQDQQLMAEQHRFGNHTPETTRLGQPEQSHDRMN
jgi:hypothetical protein